MMRRPPGSTGDWAPLRPGHIGAPAALGLGRLAVIRPPLPTECARSDPAVSARHRLRDSFGAMRCTMCALGVQCERVWSVCMWGVCVFNDDINSV